MAKKETTKKESNELSLVLNKILTCMYVVILLLVVNLGFTIVNGGSFTSNSDTEPEENTEYDVSKFDEVTPSEFLELMDSEDPVVVYIGRATCSYCTMFLPMMEEGQEEFDFTTKYVDLDGFDSDENYQEMIDEINNMTDYFNEKNGLDGENKYESIFGYTPTVVVLQSGKIKDVWIGYNEYSEYKTFLESNEL